MTDTSKNNNQDGYLLGIGILVVLAMLMLTSINSGAWKRPPHNPRMADIFMGLYILGLGTTFLVSYYFSHKSFLFRFCMWICEKKSYPSSRKMAFFYFTLASFLGCMSISQGLSAL